MSDDSRPRVRCLTPEEDSIPDADDADIDDSLPADLWFRSTGRRSAGTPAADATAAGPSR